MSQSIETAAQQASESPEAVDQAVAASLSQPAPADPVQQQINAHAKLLQSLIDRVSEAEALLATLETGALSRLDRLEGFSSDLIGSLQSHFSGKLALPEAPAPKE